MKHLLRNLELIQCYFSFFEPATKETEKKNLAASRASIQFLAYKIFGVHFVDSKNPRFAPDSAAIRINLGSTDLAPLELTFKAFLLTDVEEANKHLDSIQSHSVVGLDTEYKPGIGKQTREAKLCVVQIAVERRVYVLDMTAMQSTSTQPIKPQLTLYSLPGRFTQNPGGPVDHKMRRGLKLRRSSALDGTARQCPQLPRCGPHVTHCLSRPLSGSLPPFIYAAMRRGHPSPLHGQNRPKADWHLGLTDTAGGRDVQKLFRYAALDAQASLQIYRVLDECLLETAMQRKVRIPGEWITYHCVEGKPMRTRHGRKRQACRVVVHYLSVASVFERHRIEVESPFGHRPPVAVNRPCDADPLNLRRLATSNTDTEHA
ncbi:hypothetical protein R3P38DRAFT_3187744 [Favolaschia claudopus]|uniref:3'-5' exonuclease domain-containing protein n=1 Tax=Favolaschia claudopus TaxID=2862362 RepID=A0AAW0BYX8_9AGAR